MPNDIDTNKLYEFMGCVNASIDALSKAQANSTKSIQESITQLEKTVHARVDNIEQHLKENISDVKKRVDKNEDATDKLAADLAVAKNDIKALKEDIKSNNLKTVSGSGAAGAIAGLLTTIIKSQITGGG